MELDFKRHTVYSSDPFAVEPLARAHYFPSPERKLDEKYRRTAISPSRRDEDRVNRQNGVDRVSPLDENFLKGTNSFKYDTKASEVNNNDIDFDESWPTSEKPSSLSLTGIEDESPIDYARYLATLEKFTGPKKALNFVEEDKTSKEKEAATKRISSESKPNKMQDKRGRSRIPKKDGRKTAISNAKATPQPNETEPMDGSVLSKYVERFRNSAPMSREDRERQKTRSQSEFWWLSEQGTSNGSRVNSNIVHGNSNGLRGNSPVDNDSQMEQSTSEDVVPLTEVNLDKFGKKYYSGYTDHHKIPASPGDKKTRELQEKADRLLERSTSTVLSTDPAVSTEGLGSNMSDMSSLEEYAHRPKFAAYIEEARPQLNPYGTSGGSRPRPQPVLQPDEDPLQQWRLRRRMEQAQRGAPTHTESFNFITKTEQQKQIEAKLEDFKRKLTGKEPHNTHRSSNCHYTPAPTPVQKQAMQGTSAHHRSSSEPQIASPLLQKTKPRRQMSEVDPHLHLMCDLLPCPHQGKYQQLFTDRGTNNEDGDSSSTPEELNRGDNDKTLRDEKLNQSIYKQYLEAEKPDVDKPVENKIDKNNADSGSRVEKINRQEKGKGLKEDGYLSDKSEDYKNRLDRKQSTKDRYSSANEESKHKQKPTRTKTVSGYSDVSDEEGVGDSSLGRGRDNSTDARSNIGTETDQGRSRKERILKPTGSSSPKTERRNVDRAIGQVVKNHLFSMSTSTILSSVESLPPSASMERLPRQPQKPDVSAVEEMEETEDSDGEFPEDHLLQMLRNQRSGYEQQLKDIDEQIARLERS